MPNISAVVLDTETVRLEDITARFTSKNDIFFRWWFSADYNFTFTMLWSPFLVKSVDADPNAIMTAPMILNIERQSNGII